jgi:prepilin-type processing-associated H-X9-DG protein
VNVLGYEYEIAKLSNLGYNYLYLAPITNVSGRLASVPRNLATVATPSNTLFGVDSVADTTEDGRPVGGGSHLVVPPCRYQGSAPNLVDTFLYGGGSSTVLLVNEGWEKDVRSKLTNFGGAFPWHRGRMNVLFLDGRVQSRTPQDLTRGCNVENNFQGVIVDPLGYSWDLQ